MSGDYTGEHFEVLQGPRNGTDMRGNPSNAAVVTVIADVPCFCHGTRILTERGEVAVQELRIGERVVTASGAMQPIRWIGHRSVDCLRHPGPQAIRPVRIRANAVGSGVPYRDLSVSHDHAISLDGVLIPAKLLVNGMTIVQDSSLRRVEYFHVELDRHSILISEGLPTESYLDTGNRALFENAGLALILHPDFAVAARMQSWSEDSCAPLAVAAAEVETVWRRLAARAKEMGFMPPPPVETTTEPDLRLVVGGRVIHPIAARQGRYSFVLPRGSTSAMPCSRAASPAETEPFHEDRRRLGVAVRRLRLHTADGLREIAMDAPFLSDGWWASERAPGALWRWTDGAARIPLSDAPTMLEVELHGAHRYPMERTAQHQVA